MPTYQPNIPTGLMDLDVDYLNLQGNFQVLNSTYGVDHVPFANMTPLVTGYHGDIHFNPVSTTATQPPPNYDSTVQYPAAAGLPAVVAGIGQLFSSSVNDSVTTDTGLYWLSGNGLKVAMTRNFQPSQATNGYTFLPGGIIFQWGYVGGGHPGTNNLTFPISFPNFFLNFQATAQRNTSNVDTIYSNTPPTAGPIQTISTRQTSSVGLPFFWTAIGY